MAKRKRTVWERTAKSAREAGDRRRGLYVAARRVLAPRAAAARTRAARRSADRAAFSIPPELGFLIRDPNAFGEAREVADTAGRLLAETDVAALSRKGKAFMLPILDQDGLDRSSPFLRLALREDVLDAVGSYLATAPVLSSIQVYLSRPGTDDEPISSQLLHCDGDDTRQIKLFVLCGDVDEASGPLMLLDATQSKRLRRAVGYRYRERVTDEQARDALGDVALVPVVGRAGTAAFVDTSRCFHYGSRVADAEHSRLVAIVQYLTPYSFMLPRDVSAGARFRRLAEPGDVEPVRLALGAA